MREIEQFIYFSDEEAYLGLTVLPGILLDLLDLLNLGPLVLASLCWFASLKIATAYC